MLRSVLAFALCACGGASLADGGADTAPSTDARADAGADGAVASPVDEALARLASPDADAASLDALLHEVAWTDGWPLRDGARFLFATRWDDAPAPVALVSGAWGWDPALHPAARAASGVHFYVVVDAAEIPEPRGEKYKWHGGPDVFRAPPESTAYGYDSFGAYGLVAPPREAPWLERFPAHRSAFLEHPRALRAYLPAGFEARSARAASARVVLFHDGQNVFHPDAPFGGWRADEALAALGDVVALAIDNAPDRMDAYTHVSDRIGASTVGGRADDYVRLVTEEALPFARERYGVRAEGASLAIAGSSLGGLVSLHLALWHPELARCVIAMSPTLGWGAFAPGLRDAMIHRFTSRGPSAVYLDSGGGGTCADLDGDGVQDDGDDRDNYCVTTQMRDHLAGLGYVHGVDLFHWHEPGAPHAEVAWAARLPRALESCVSAGWR